MTIKNNFNYWESRRNHITSKTGKWIGGKDVISHGVSLMNEMLGQKSYMQMLVLNATGKMIDERLSQWLEGNFIGMSYPDSRIWCNQIGALCGSGGTTVVAATVAGTLASDSRAYGGSQTNKIGMEFIQQALIQQEQGAHIQDIINRAKFKDGKPVITGYARPVQRNDERIVPHENMTKSLGFAIGPHLSLAYKISEFLQEKYNLGMNIGGYSSAFLSDQNFTPDEVYRIKSLVVASGVTASFVDNHNNSNGFLPLHCSDLDYQGPPPRALK